MYNSVCREKEKDSETVKWSEEKAYDEPTKSCWRVNDGDKSKYVEDDDDELI